MFDLKVINAVLGELEEERGIPREKVISAIESAMGTAYKKEYGKHGQDIRAKIDMNTGATEFIQVKTVVDETTVRFDGKEIEAEEAPKRPASRMTAPEPLAEGEEEPLPRFDPEKHILLADAKFIKRDTHVGDELVFPLENKGDFGRIAAQTAKQVIIQKIREAEKVSVLAEFGKRVGEIVSGTVERVERGNLYVNLGRAVGIIPYNEQIPGERYRQGERVRGLLYEVEDGVRGAYLRISRAHPQFLAKLFAVEAPEVANGMVLVKSIAREAGSRSKIAVASIDSHVDPVGSMVGQRGVRVTTVTSELGGEKIDIIEWSENPKTYIEEALSPARTVSVVIDEENHRAAVTVSDDQQSLAIGRGGQNVRLAAKLTGWNIDIKGVQGDAVAKADEHGALVPVAPVKKAEAVTEQTEKATS